MSKAKVYYIAIILLLISNVVLRAQQSEFQKVDALNEQCFDLGSSHPDAALKIGEKSLLLAQKSKYTNGEITALCRIGRTYFKKGQYQNALSWYDRSENCFYKNGKDSIFLAKTFVYQGLTLVRLGRSQNAIGKYERSYQMALTRKDFILLGQIMINLSSLYIEQSNFPKALKFLHDALKQFPTSETSNLGMIHLNIGNIYETQGRLDDALNEFSKARRLFFSSGNAFSECESIMSLGNIFMHKYQKDSSMHYYKNALQIARKEQFESLEGVINYNIGELYFTQKNTDSAYHYFNKSLELKEKCDDWTHQSLLFERIGDILIIQGKPKEAVKKYLRSYEFSSGTDDQMQIVDITQKLATLYAQMGDINEAFRYSNLSGQYKDSIKNKITEALIYEMHYKDEKNQRIKLKNELAVRNLKINKQSSLIIFLIIVGMLIILFLLVMLKLYQQRKKKLIVERDHLEAKKEIDHLLNDQERVAINAMLDGQELERNRIAGELHDKFGATLSVVKLYFQSIDEQIDLLKEENIRQFQKANILLDEACDDARKIAHDLSSGMLTKMGLFKVVDELQQKIADSGQIKVVLSTFGTDDDLKLLNEVAIYRIIQELISNALKYAKASELSIQLNVFKEENIFNLLVEDDGIGYDVDKMSEKAGMGIRSIKARVENMFGNMEIDSVIGRGTSVSIDFPLNQPKKSE